MIPFDVSQSLAQHSRAAERIIDRIGSEPGSS
jgi:hypothetical protein